MMTMAADKLDLFWLCQMTGAVLTANARGIKAVDSRGHTRGVIAYDNWTENSCQAHMAVSTPIAWRTLLGSAFSYPFEELGRGLILAVIQSSNIKSLKVAAHMGFRMAHRVRDGWAIGEDLVMLELRREDCRWIQPQRKAA